MKIKEIKDMDVKTINTRLAESREKVRELRFGLANQKTKKVRELRFVKKDIARLLTVLQQKRVAQQQTAK